MEEERQSPVPPPDQSRRMHALCTPCLVHNTFRLFYCRLSYSFRRLPDDGVTSHHTSTTHEEERVSFSSRERVGGRWESEADGDRMTCLPANLSPHFSSRQIQDAAHSPTILFYIYVHNEPHAGRRSAECIQTTKQLHSVFHDMISYANAEP